MKDKEAPQCIGRIHNYYGGLEVRRENGKSYWGVEDWDGTDWEEIPDSLYRALLRFEKARAKKTKTQAQA